MSKNLFELMDDMHLNSQDLFLDYYNAMFSNNIELAQKILNDNPELANQITNSENINELIDRINKREKRPIVDIDDKLNELDDEFEMLIRNTKEMGRYDPTVQYYSHNFVSYNGKYYYAKSNPPLGTSPTDANYWQEYDIKGLQGYGGISNIKYRGNWDSTVQYNLYDSVVYQNKIWWAIDNNINSVPNLNHYPWQPIAFPTQATRTPIQKEQPTMGYSEGDFWFQIIEGEDVQLSSWTSLSPELVAVTAASSFIIDNTIYIVNGQAGDLSSISLTQAYDITTNTWSYKAPIPDNFDGAMSFSLNGKGYIIGGINSMDYTPAKYFNTVWCYNPTDNTWTSKNNFPISTANVNGGVVCNGKAYVNTGLGEIEHKEIYVYDEDNDTWALETSFSSTCISPATQAIGNKIYFIGGDDNKDNISDEVKIYDVSTKTWSLGKGMISPRVYSGSFVNGNYIYVFGGFDKTFYSVDTVEQYDIINNVWRPQSPMQYARNSLNGEAYGEYGYALGGINIMQPMVGGYVERFQFDTAR